MAKALFLFLGILCLCPLLGLPLEVLAYIPPASLIAGIAIAVTVGNPYPNESKRISKLLLQAAVVCLGFSLDLYKIVEAGSDGLGFAVVSIAGVFLLGWVLQRFLNVRPITGLLVTSGTAICGGSAIAAVSSVTDAPQEDVSVSVGTVFLFNALALLVFPPLGHFFGMTPEQFGIWAGIAIHDVSSVVGAATAFGEGALETATAVKLSRVLYLVPITLIIASLRKKQVTQSGVKAAFPWFVLLFILASFLRTAFEPVQDHAGFIKAVAVAGFSLSLYLIGAGISVKILKSVGPRPLILGFILWIAISAAAFFLARAN